MTHVDDGIGSRTGAFGPAEWALLAAVASLAGSSFLFIDVGLRSLEPGVIAAARLLLGAGALALLSRARRAVAGEDLPRVALLGVIWMGVPLILFPVAQQWIDSSVAGMLNGAAPLTTAAWSVLLLRRLPGRAVLTGLAVGFAGVLAVSWPSLAGSRSTALGVALVMAAVVLYGLAANLAVPLQQRYGALPVLLRSQLAALVLVLPFGLGSLPDPARRGTPRRVDRAGFDRWDRPGAPWCWPGIQGGTGSEVVNLDSRHRVYRGTHLRATRTDCGSDVSHCRHRAGPAWSGAPRR